jgi:integrase
VAQRVLIADIAGDMYVPGSVHVKRRQQLGKSTEIATLVECRRYIDRIIDIWGSLSLPDLSVDHVMSHFFALDKSATWKNRFLEVLGEIYAEAAWHGCKVMPPPFTRFVRNSKKADIFTTEELDRLFQPDNFPGQLFHLFFLLCLSAGMRLGEARAVRVKQIVFDHGVLIIDGFCKKDGTRTVYNKKGTPDHPRLRLVYLPDLTLSQLRRWIDTNGLRSDDFCFALDGHPIRQEYAERVFYRALQSAGIIALPQPHPRAKRGEGRQKQDRRKLPAPDGRKLVPHSLRYTYVSRMRRELTAAELQPMSGHASIENVDYYNRKALDLIMAGLPTRGKAATEALFV